MKYLLLSFLIQFEKGQEADSGSKGLWNYIDLVILRLK